MFFMPNTLEPLVRRHVVGVPGIHLEFVLDPLLLLDAVERLVADVALDCRGKAWHSLVRC